MLTLIVFLIVNASASVIGIDMGSELIKVLNK